MTPVVVVAKLPDGGTRYARYVGREATHIVDAEGWLLPGDVEALRSDPEAMLNGWRPDVPAAQ